jgi:hypothetical protein
MLFDWQLEALEHDSILLTRHFSLPKEHYLFLFKKHIDRFLEDRKKQGHKPLIFWHVMLQRLLLRAEYARFEMANVKDL